MRKTCHQVSDARVHELSSKIWSSILGEKCDYAQTSDWPPHTFTRERWSSRREWLPDTLTSPSKPALRSSLPEFCHGEIAAQRTTAAQSDCRFQCPSSPPSRDGLHRSSQKAGALSGCGPFAAPAMALGFDDVDSHPVLNTGVCEEVEALKNGSSDVRIPILGIEEISRRLQCEANAARYTQFRSMYSSIVGAITTDVAAMVVPLDDHMVHRGHSVFDTTSLVSGNLYELDTHLDRFLDSAAKAKITSPFSRATVREILIQTVAAGHCQDGTLRFWLSAGRGDFELSTKNCKAGSLYACLLERSPIKASGNEPIVEIKAVTSTVPIKPKVFATIKTTNYLPNALALREAEEKGAQAGIWLDEEGNVAEGNNLNVGFVSIEGEVLLPPFDSILPGCTARRLLQLVPELVKEAVIPGLEGVRLAKIPVVEAKNAAEMMLLGSFVTILPVVEWDGKLIGNGKPGRISMALRKCLLQYMLTGPSALLTPVPRYASAASCCLRISPVDYSPTCSDTSRICVLDGPDVIPRVATLTL